MTSLSPPGGLIVTSLRLPFVTRLATGGEAEVVREESRDEWARSVAHLVSETGGQWVGWAGPALASAHSLPPPAGAGLGAHQVIPVFLSQTEVEAQYLHCRGALWPLLHSMADRAVFSESHWAQYSRVNQIFAEATLAALRTRTDSEPGEVPTIWVHDYHLMEVPNIVATVAAEEGLACRIGYFHHVPFPPWDMIKIHPWKDIFLQGMLGSDLIGIHYTESYLTSPHLQVSSLLTSPSTSWTAVSGGWAPGWTGPACWWSTGRGAGRLKFALYRLGFHLKGL